MISDTGPLTLPFGSTRQPFCERGGEHNTISPTGPGRVLRRPPGVPLPRWESMMAAHWPQVPRKGPEGDALSLPSRLLVREAEVDAEPDPGVDHFPGSVRDSAVNPWVRADRHGGRGTLIDLEVQMVGPEEQLQDGGERPRHAVGAGRVIRVGRGLGTCREVAALNERRPRRITDRGWVGVGVPFADCRNGTPDS